VYQEARATTTASVVLTVDSCPSLGVPTGQLLPAVRQVARRGWVRIAVEAVNGVTVTLTHAGVALAEDALAESEPGGEASRRRALRTRVLQHLGELFGEDRGETANWDALAREFGASPEEANAMLSYWVDHGSIYPVAIKDHGRLVALTAQGVLEARALADWRNPTLAEITSLLAHPSHSSDLTAWQPQADPDVGVFRRFGDKWLVEFRGERAYFNATKGMAYLAHLIGNRGLEFPPLQILQAVEGEEQGSSSRRWGRAALEVDGLEDSGLPDAGPVMDVQALREVRTRLSEVQDQLRAAEERNDLGGLESLQTEEEQLLECVRQATGLGGRPRKGADHRTRVRERVQKNIKRAMKKIEDSLPELYAHLSNALRYSPHFSYRPAHPIFWEI